MQAYRKVAFHTLGCKLNFSETSTIARLFEDGGYARVEIADQPDVVVINTCSVTDQADKKCRNIVSRALRNNPNAFVAVVGCYAQLKPEEIATIPGVDIVLGANEKFNILEHIQNSKLEKTQTAWSPIKDVKQFIPGYSFGDRTRTFFKVQDGCDYFCSFCTIPLARGRSRSASVVDTVAEIEKVAKTGVKEVVLTGVNIGDFGAGTNENLLDLIREFDKIEGIARFRISSIEPNLLTDEIIRFVATSQKFVPHFHIPLQSGNDEILQRMRRRYDRALYADRIKTIKTLMPNCCIGVDVITGFPGETHERFVDTMQFLIDLDISYLHVFTYSERDNTTAVRMDEVVPMEERRRRTLQLQNLSDKKRRAFYEAQRGKTMRVLFEQDEDEGRINGFTDNYVKVSIPFDENLRNTTQQVELLDFWGDSVAGLLVKEVV